MIVKPSDWSPQFFQQKGWIASKFEVKNPNKTALRWKKRNHTEIHQHPNHPAHLSHPKSQFQSTQSNKPSTAPEISRSKVEIIQNLQKIGASNSSWEEKPSFPESCHPNFRATLCNRKQLLYLKPYLRYQNNSSLTIDQKKMEIYKEINNPDINIYIESFESNPKIIEYLTEYKDPFTRSSHPPQPRTKGKVQSKHRMSLNILRQKLKQKCEPSGYKSKINAIKFQ